MRMLLLLGVFAALFSVGIFASSYAQVADHVVINEVETNPPGDDARAIIEWVELYNPTEQDVNIGGWQIISTSIGRKTLTLPPGTVIKAGQYTVHSNTILWFPDLSAKVQLKDRDGNIVDETPSLTDQKNDFSSWQRKYDGLDTGATNDWVFRTSNAGSSNGRLEVQSTEGIVTVFIDSDKRSYLFSETATITGSVSERVYQVKPSFSQQQVQIVIDGPGNYQKKVMLYPDLNLNFKTTLKLDRVLGIGEGTYRVFVTYGSAQDSTAFAVGDELASVDVEIESELGIFTDNISYIPGQTVRLSGSTNTVIPLEGLKLSILDSKGKQIYTGTLYPNTKGEFTANSFLTTVNPAYGTYTVTAEYGRQYAKTTFEVLQDAKDISQIVLSTDKKVYGQGETIVVSGRSNKYVPALDIEVIQTGSGSIGKTISNIFSIKGQVSLAGDSSFKYELRIPATEGNLGDYRVTVSKEFGKATTTFKIVQNPDEFIPTDGQNFVTTDKAEYALGETVNVSGHVVPKSRASFAAIPVSLIVEDGSGKPLTIIKRDTQLKTGDHSNVAQYTFTAIPDGVGNYKIQFKADQAIFAPGKYSIKAEYDGAVVRTEFSVVTGTSATDGRMTAKTDKQVYGLGEKVTLEGSLVSGQSAVKITLTKPDGKSVVGGAVIDNSKFAWSWNTPTKEYTLADIRDPRSVRPTVFGNYKITISSASQSLDVFFKVSPNPQTDTLVIAPLTVSTDKTSYTAGERLVVSGSAIKRESATGASGSIIPDRVEILVRTAANKVIYNSMLEFDAGGQFKTSYQLPLTIFKDGKYKVTAIYQKLRVETTFDVQNNLPFGSDDKLTLTLNTDRVDYYPGDTVQITGSANKLISLKKLDLVIVPQSSETITCGNFYCGLGGKKVDITRSYQNGVYSYNHVISNDAPLETYLVKVDTEFGTFTKTFNVVERPAPEPELAEFEAISEKFNRMPESEFDIGLFSKSVDGRDVAPWSVLGSLITTRGAEPAVNMRVVADDGQCVIGQGAGCLVSGSTDAELLGYAEVRIAGIDYFVEYSGPDKSVEKFMLVPIDSASFIPDSVWQVQIEKDGQPSRFYYEVVYRVQ